jgi:hypothetical protein
VYPETAWVEKQRPEAERESIEYREIGRSPPGAIDNQELLFHEHAVSDDGLRITGSQEFGGRG